MRVRVLPANSGIPAQCGYNCYHLLSAYCVLGTFYNNSIVIANSCVPTTHKQLFSVASTCKVLTHMASQQPRRYLYSSHFHSWDKNRLLKKRRRGLVRCFRGFTPWLLGYIIPWSRVRKNIIYSILWNKVVHVMITKKQRERKEESWPNVF